MHKYERSLIILLQYRVSNSLIHTIIEPCDSFQERAIVNLNKKD